MSRPVSTTTSKDKKRESPENPQRDMPQPQAGGLASGLLSLQRAIGNTAVGHLLRSETRGGSSFDGTVQRKHLSCDTPEDLPSPCKSDQTDLNDHVELLEEVQPKLTVCQPGDPYEQEADRVAEQVMRMPDLSVELESQAQTGIQRKCSECSSGGGTCSKCEEERIHRSSLSPTASILLQRQ